jgi:hypothetical protein
MAEDPFATRVSAGMRTLQEILLGLIWFLPLR